MYCSCVAGVLLSEKFGMTSEAEKLDDVELFVYPDKQCVVFDMAFHAALVFSDYITLNVPPRAFSNVPLQIWSL